MNPLIEEMVAAAAPVAVQPHEARVIITYTEGDTFDLPRPVVYDGSSKEDFKRWAVEMMRGGFEGRAADPDADLDDYFVQECPRPANPGPGQRTYNLVLIRPKTTYGC